MVPEWYMINKDLGKYAFKTNVTRWAKVVFQVDTLDNSWEDGRGD